MSRFANIVADKNRAWCQLSRGAPSLPLEPFNIGENSLFVNVGERNNVNWFGFIQFLIIDEKYEEALSVAVHQVENGAQIIDINMDEGMLE